MVGISEFSFFWFGYRVLVLACLFIVCGSGLIGGGMGLR